MLKTSKSIAISGRSMVDDKQVATFNANIYEANASGGKYEFRKKGYHRCEGSVVNMLNGK